MDTDLKWVISEEERTRHDALFYSQSPKKGYLSGEQARSLFIRSRLPLSELSKIWKLADISRDNLLDVSEFAVAMHLIQLRLRGLDIPEKLPSTLTPVQAKVTVVPPITTEEWNAYSKIFAWKDANNSGFLETEPSCVVIMMSNLDTSILSKIWNLSDIDRDGKLSRQEFAIAFHLLRFCKKGNELEGSIDVKTLLPIEALKDDGEAMKKRHADVQTERRKLMMLKQDFCSELARGLSDTAVNEKIRPELNKVEDRLSALEKEETQLRRSLLNLKDRTKKDSFKPFDKSFLLEKRLSGQNLFESRVKKPSIDKESALFERLWTLSGTNLENILPINYSNNGATTTTINFNNNFTETQPSDITSEKTKSTNAPRILNGVAEDDKSTRSRESSKLVTDRKEISDQSPEKSKETTITSRSSEVNQKDNLESSFSSDLDSKRKVAEEKVQETLLAKPRKVVERDESFSWARIEKRPVVTKRVHEEVLDIPPAKKDQGKRNNYKTNNLVQEEVSVDSIENVESAADQNIDKMFQQMSIDLEDGAVNGIKHKTNYKLPVGRVLSFEEEKQLKDAGAFKKAERQVPSKRNPTQEDLLPIYLEERKAVEEERRKKREIEEEKIKQAREDLKKQEEENRRQLFQRKGAMQEARGKMEKHLSQSDNDVCRTAGYFIERELEEQRQREEEAQNRMKELRKNEMLYQKGKDQTSRAKQVYIDTGKAGDNNPQPVNRRAKTEPKQHGHRKSWVELEIEEQKRKDDEMRREIEQRNFDLDRLGKEQKPLHAIKKEIEISESSIKNKTSHIRIESNPPPVPMGTKRSNYSDVDKLDNKTQRRGNTPENRPSDSRTQGNVKTDHTPIDVVDGKMTFQERQMERKFLDEEERRQKEQIEQYRQESLKREAEELMRQKVIREEELRKKREIALKEAEKRNREEEERLAAAQKIAESRRLAFYAQKVKLEERVINTMKESVQSNKGPEERKDEQNVSSSQSDVAGKRKSVYDRKALFEQPAPTHGQDKVVMRQKRHSLNLEDSGSQQKPSKKDRASFYSDGTSTQQHQMQMTKEKESRISERDDQPTPTRLNLGNISEKRQQFEVQRQQNSVERRQAPTTAKGAASESNSLPSLNQQDATQPMTDSFFPAISNNKIQREMAELKQREQEIQIRRQAMVQVPSTDKDPLENVKKNPLPNKMQVQRGSSTTSEGVVRREKEQKPAAKRPNRKSFIEIEKEKEIEREKELQREREAIMREVELHKKKGEIEAKQKTQEDKDKEIKKNKSSSGGPSRLEKRGQFH